MTYVISLSPELKSKKCIKKIFKGNEGGNGIGFTKIKKVDISFDYYDQKLVCDKVEINALGLNVVRFTGGICGRAYSF